jgi:tripartite-type tricarboxylate transporter receptor subunit TctC
MSTITATDINKLRQATGAGMPQLPDVPTLIELGFPDFEVSSWSGLMAPTGTPPDIINLLAKTTIEIMKAPDMRKQLEGIGAFPVGSTPEEFKKVKRFYKDIYNTV